jgi:L-fuconolactonase
MERIRRDFLPGDLESEIAAAGVGGVVTVQARQTLEETGWLLDLAVQHTFIRGVVGWVPLADARAGEILARLAGHAGLKGVRHVLHDEPDDFYMLREDFNAGLRAVTRAGLVYDILIFERHLPQTIEFVDRHPDQVFVVDHIAKPRIRDGAMSPWRERLRELARRPNVFCKISGMVTEADWDSWTGAQLRPCFDAALDAFGPRRLMFGSDWPVCLLACGYGPWHALVSRWIEPLSPGEREAILAGTATRVYKL